MTDVSAQAYREAAQVELDDGNEFAGNLLLAAAEQREQWDVLTKENKTLMSRVEGLRRTLDNDPAGVAKRLQNLASAFSTCDLCEGPCEDDDSPNTLCGPCLSKLRQQIATLTAERDEAREQAEKWFAATPKTGYDDEPQ